MLPTLWSHHVVDAYCSSLLSASHTGRMTHPCCLSTDCCLCCFLQPTDKPHKNKEFKADTPTAAINAMYDHYLAEGIIDPPPPGKRRTEYSAPGVFCLAPNMDHSFAAERKAGPGEAYKRQAAARYGLRRTYENHLAPKARYAPTTRTIAYHTTLFAVLIQSMELVLTHLFHFRMQAVRWCRPNCCSHCCCSWDHHLASTCRQHDTTGCWWLRQWGHQRYIILPGVEDGIHG